MRKGHSPAHPRATGRITLAEVLRLAVTQFGVEPLRARVRDWETILTQLQGAVED
jgi:hypothetical protein